MKNRKTVRSGMIWLLISVSLMMVMVFGQIPAWAIVTCPTASTTDSDGDGFTDQEECDGITLADGSHFNGFLQNGTDFLDPNKKDLFVIWVPATPSNLPLGSDPIQYVRDLPINVHLLTPVQATSERIISPTSTLQQKALRVTESLDYDPTQPIIILGISLEGTPNAPDNAAVFTERIKNHIILVYQSATGCDPATTCMSIIPPDLISTYIKHTIAHEIGHMLRPLAPVSQRDYENFGGCHYKSGTNAILDQSAKYTIKGGKVTFYIGTFYTLVDKENVTLR